MPRSARFAVFPGLLAALVACSDTQVAREPREFLDERTGATVSTVERPLIFAREHSERAANNRDYVTLAAAAVNRSGKVQYVLIAYVWSTLGVRDPAAASVAGTLVLAADDRRIPLGSNVLQALDAGVSLRLHAPPGDPVAPQIYPIDLATLRFVSLAGALTVRSTTDEAVIYELWDDQRPALSAFVQFMGGGP